MLLFCFCLNVVCLFAKIDLDGLSLYTIACMSVIVVSVSTNLNVLSDSVRLSSV